MAEKKVTKTPGQQVAPPANAAQQTPAQTYDFSGAGVTGMENVTQQDLGTPFLMILQKGSPEIDKTHPDYKDKKIEGAEVGDIINTVTREVVYSESDGKPLKFVPCKYEKLFVEWKSRDNGGGIVKMHQNANILLNCTRNEKGQDVLPNGNIIATTAYFFGIYTDDNGDRVKCCIGLTSTQLKKARHWLNLANALKLTNAKGQRYTPPLFSHDYLITTQAESNEKGSWYGWSIQVGTVLSDGILIADAIETAKMASATARQALPPPSDEGGEKEVPY